MTEQKLAIGKTYIIKLAKESRILRTLGIEKCGDHNREISDITEVIYPVGMPGFQTGTSKGFFSLEQAVCFFSDDGIAAMQLQLRPKAPETLILAGNFVFRDQVITIHIKGTGLYGLKIAIDGICHAEKNSYILTGLLSISIRGITQVETVKLKLCKVTKTILTDRLESAIQEFRQSIEFSKILPPSPEILSEASEYIGGVPVPTIFDATIVPNIDGRELPPMKGQLMLDRLEGCSNPTIYLTLATNSALMTHGWSAWMTADNQSSQPTDTMAFDKQPPSQDELALPNTFKITSPTSLETGVEVTVENKLIQVSIKPVGKFRSLIWQAEDDLDPTDETSVTIYAEKGTIELEVAGDAFSGSISAQGKAMGSKKAVRTFSAQLFGERQGSAFVKGIASFMGPRPFEGSWQDSSLGAITLQQKQSRITGNFGEGRYVEGHIVGQVANLRYRDSDGNNSHGFLAKTDNSLLVGLTWADDVSEPKAVIAVQAMPLAPNYGYATIPNPQNDAEARELRFLGYDLYSAQKYQEAAFVLEKVVNYLSNREKLTTAPFTQASYLLEQGIPLQSLILSANAANDYPRLVSALTLAIDLQRRKGKSINEARDSYGFLCLQEHVLKTIENFDEHSDRMALLAESFDRGEKILSTGGIGVRFEEKLDKVGIKILRVLPETPASQAGIIGGDVLIAVDAIPIAKMTHDQVSKLLRGEIGSIVSVRVLRNGEVLEVNTVRAPLIAISSERKNELVKSSSKLSDTASQLRDSFLLHIEQLKQALLDVPDVSRFFKSLVVRLNQSIEASQEERLATIAIAEKGLARAPHAIDLFRRFVIQMQEVKKVSGNFDTKMITRLLNLDEEIEAFEDNPTINEFDKDFFKSVSIMIASFDHIILSLSGRLRMVEQSEKSAEEGVFEPLQTAEVMIGLSRFLDNWRAKLATDAAKISSLDNSQSFYNTYISTLIRMSLPEEALQASEAARARAFADLLSERHQTTGDRNSSEDNFSYSSTPTLSLKEIKQIAVIEQGTIVEYFLLPKHSHSAAEQTAKDCIAVWVVVPQASMPEVSIRLLQIPVDLKTLEANINRLVDLMTASLDTEYKRLEVAGLLRKLHGLLIEPLEREQLLPISSEASETITIIPHGNLFSVPFAALLDEEDRYLVEKCALNHATSLSVLKYLQHNKANIKSVEQRHLLALVNPDPLPRSEEDIGNRLLPPLLQTAESFSKISDFYSSPEHREVYAGVIATESVLCEQATHADVLYFATHAEINADNPLNSFIALAETTQHSGYFRASDVSKLRLHAELVILAACETARGQMSSDGINGLSRAFTQAGASALLMSLWKVPEERTTLLMVGFHHHWLQKTQAKTVALQNTQKEFCKLKKYRDQPNLWAGFILFGSS